MRNVVRKFIGPHEKELNEELIKLALYYRFEPVVTNVYSGNEKGHVEKSVQILRNKAFTKQYEFQTIEEAQKQLDKTIDRLNETTDIGAEQENLKSLPAAYGYAITTKQSIDKYSFVHVQGNHYSVPDYLVDQQVTVKRYLYELKIIRNGHLICTHALSKGEKQFVVDINHYLPTFLRKPKALEHSLVLKNMPRLHQCFLQHYKQTPRRFLQFIDKQKQLPMEQLVHYLEEEALKDQKVFKSSPSKAVNEARSQLQEYNRMHQVRKVKMK
ncbi:Mu transposase domain-containing protein [Listeria rocourtiae]|uniref:Mu transposase domain-containing protein n=1 Tax=Listeria rocourtiae TaxID=647910 RepID=UPI001C89523D|nr:hypothetical protein [Listeria rocourtiae]